MKKRRGPTLRARFALEQLEIVTKIPAGPTCRDLRFNPCWDDWAVISVSTRLSPQPTLPAENRAVFLATHNRGGRPRAKKGNSVRGRVISTAIA
jgi:hypothetical protein